MEQETDREREREDERKKMKAFRQASEHVWNETWSVNIFNPHDLVYIITCTKTFSKALYQFLII